MSLDSNALQDVLGRNVISRPEDDGLIATEYIPDTTPPFIVNSTLNMTSRDLMLSFSEPINVTSFVTTALGLTNEDGGYK